MHLYCYDTRYTSRALSFFLAPNGTSIHIGGKNNTNNTPLSPMVFGNWNGNGNSNNNNNNGITPSETHTRNNSANSVGVGMVVVHGYATRGSISLVDQVLQLYKMVYHIYKLNDYLNFH